MNIKVPVECEFNHARAKSIATKAILLIHKEIGSDLVLAVAVTKLIYDAISEVFVEDYGQEEYNRIFKNDQREME